MFADKIESEKSKTRKRQLPPPSASTAVLIIVSFCFSFSLSLDPSSKQWLLPVHDFLWHLTGGLGASFFSISSSFSAPLLPQLVIGDCNFVGLVGLAYSLAWLSLACLFSVTFRISFHVIARAWQQFQLGPSFWSVFKAQLATTSLPLRSTSLPPLAHLTPSLVVGDSTLSDLSRIVWNLYKHTHTHTHVCWVCVRVCVCVCLFVSVWVWMNQARSFELRFIIFCSARCFFLLIYTIIFYTPLPFPLTIAPPPLTSFKSRRLIV